jgi:hypothetical protein
MSQNRSGLILSVFIIYFIINSIKDYGKLNCSTPIELWQIGNLFIFLSICLMSEMAEFIDRLPTVFQALFVIYCALFLAFVLVWNIIGTFWIITNIIAKNNCMTISGIIITFASQAIVYFLYIIGIYLGFSLYKSYLNEKVEEKNFTKKLLKLYKDKEYLKNTNIQEFVTKNKTVMEKVNILEIEKEIILNKFTKKVTEETKIGECIICIANFEIDDLRSTMTCEHAFHFDCLIDWFKIKPNCPVCRVPFRKGLLEQYYNSVSIEV